LFLIAVAGCAAPPPPDPQLVAQWLRTSLAFVRSERLGPPVASRISAYGSIALYEGYAADPRSGLRSLMGQLNGFDDFRARAASEGGPPDGAIVAAEAERVVLDSLFRDGFAATRRTIDSLAGAQIAARLAAGVSSAMSRRSIEHGSRLGAAILAWAATDSFFATRGRPWIAPVGRGFWVNTATTAEFIPVVLSAQSDLVMPKNPGLSLELERASEKFVFANRPREARPTTLPTFNPVRPTEPFWGNLRPFVTGETGDRSPEPGGPARDACDPPPPPPYSETPGSEFWRMGKEFYDTVRAVTDEQRQIALFWADNPVATGTPGFHWISVVNQMIARRSLTADQAVELYALTSIAIADAFIGCWKEKYHSNVVRPVTYVRRVFDAKYTTVFPTPPFPEYPSGHSTLSAAAVEVLTHFLGDTVPFVDSTQVDIGHPPRPYPSFTAARDEVAVSRVYGGVHYWPAVRNGIAQGECIGRRVVERVRTRS
jgi:membrane-associated phospholipid phosphatase